MDNSGFGTTNISFTSHIEPLNNDGATSDTYKICIDGIWYFQKRPKPQYIEHPHYLAAFEKEFSIGSTLNHPNIVTYLKKEQDDNGVYLLTEYVDGWNLKEFIEKNPLYFKYKDHRQKFTEQLLSALEYLHNHKILHLDLKPENIMISYVGLDVKLIDLGFSYSSGHLYQTIGKTNEYAAPEQLSENNTSINQCTDIYGFGMILLYIFTQSTNKNLISKIPQPYKDCAEKCLQQHPAHRFQQTGEVKAFLKKKLLERKILKIFWIVFALFFAILIVLSLLEVFSDQLPTQEVSHSKFRPFIYIRNAIFMFALAVSINYFKKRKQSRKNTINR